MEDLIVVHVIGLKCLYLKNVVFIVLYITIFSK